MGKILIIDDTKFWRDIASQALRLKGHSVATAEDGMEGLAALKADGADLVILDVEMPKLEGFAFLEQIRRREQWKALPVIMLTGEMHKDRVLRAKKLGAVDYLLKTRFSMAEMADRVEKRLEAAKPVLVKTTPPKSTECMPAQGSNPHQLVDRQKCLARAEHAMQACTLSGVASQIIMIAGSPRLDLSDLSTMIGRDPMLSARILQAANSVAYTSSRGTISTIPEAVRMVGAATIREIATSLAVFQAMPTPEPDGFNLIRCWQHSIAVGTLCSMLANEAQRPLAYLTGLCHDLGEILFRSHFGAEYRQVLEAEKASGKSRQQLEIQMLGMSQGDLAQTILKKLELPEIIRRPIFAFHSATAAGATATDPMARLLHLADAFADGALLGSSDHALLGPVNRPDCCNATGVDDPTKPDIVELRTEVYVLTAQYARLPSRDQAALIQPQFPQESSRIWLTRDACFSTFDPIAAALESLSDTTVHTSLPGLDDLAACDALVVVSRGINSTEFTVENVARAAAADGTSRPVLWLTSRDDTAQISPPPGFTFAKYPIPTNQLAAFVHGVSSS